MKSIVLLIVLIEVVFSLAQVGKNQDTRRFHSIPPPQQNVPLCQLRGIPQNPWPKIGMNQMISPGSPPNNAAWRTNEIGKNHYQWIPPQQKVQGCLIPPQPWLGLRTNEYMLPSPPPSNAAWRTNQIGKNSYPWIPPPQQKVQGCLIPPNPWPKLGTNQLISPAPSPSNVGWRPNQGMFNWINPFDFGLPNYYPPWGYQQQYPSSPFSRYTPRLPVASNLGMPIHLPIQPAIHRPWPIQPQLGSPPGRWHMQFFGPQQGIWHILPQMGSTYPPFYIADRI